MAAAGRRARTVGVAGARTWMDAESRLWPASVLQIAQLVRRASRRWVLVTALSLAAALLAALLVSLKADEFSAEVVLRLVEGQQQRASMSKEQLQGAIWDVAFSRPRLLELVRRLNLSPQLVDQDPALAVDRLRGAMSLTVWQNDLISGAQIRRSVRVSIGYRTRVREGALPVARALAELLVNTQGAQRRETLAAQAGAAGEAAKRAAAQANAQRTALAGLVAAQVPDPRAVGIATGALRAAEERLKVEQARAVEAQNRLREAAEGHELRFEEADPGHEPPLPRSKIVLMLLTVAIVALVAFPVCLLMVGAFDPYVATEDDVIASGIPILGTVPGSFPPRRGGGRASQQSV